MQALVRPSGHSGLSVAGQFGLQVSTSPSGADTMPSPLVSTVATAAL
jgi:hypothetical protein